jgi:hypothetical protein
VEQWWLKSLSTAAVHAEIMNSRIALPPLDLEGDCSYSWPGIGFPLAEVGNMGALVRGAIAIMQKRFGED